MNLYLISQDENSGYDTYDAAVVAAESEADVRLIHPTTENKYEWESAVGGWYMKSGFRDGDVWASSPSLVKVQLIGQAVDGTKQGVILASFHAG